MTEGEGRYPEKQRIPADFNEPLLVEEILGGRKELFRLLVERYQQKVHAMGLSFFHNQEDAADFTQDVFIRSYRSLATFRGQSRFSTWLYRIAYNTAVNSINRRKEYHSLAEEPVTEDESPELHILRVAAQEAVRSAVAELPEKYRVCVDLYFFYDCSIREIGEITGFPENTIKSHVFRGKKLLREKLADEQ
ncbi:MAG: sigma-70 family RNA polymerase sigma factor [Spirochaetaceae bacterium]|jgi:RNA polymerase sigma-70 factor (ECF subfamily)|nr:sigma-70 family RNA polymerase sigma factor [Spirochaetaceae bacterium]